MADNMPPDPFGAHEMPDVAQFAANCYALYAGFLGAGFGEAHALRFTIDITIAMMTATAKR